MSTVLTDAVERERKQAGVRSLDLSFNELADMYRTGELHITPEYQRTFRWSGAKQSQFVESVVLEMPIPPIYAVEVGEGKWELIDGLQRLSTYLHFRGQLDLPDQEPPIKKDHSFLTLEGCDIVPALNGFTFDKLPTSIQYRIRRATLRVELVRQERNPRFAYYMFKRLNTGGEPLSNQEARNCSIRLLGTTFSKFLTSLKSDAGFQECIADVTDEYRARMGEEELILRFFAFKEKLAEYVHDIDPFLTGFMERATDESAPDHIAFSYFEQERQFRKTFKTLAAALGPAACRRWVGTAYGGGFSVSHYEAFSIGLAKFADRIPNDPDQALIDSIAAALADAKKDPELRKLTTGGGKNFRSIYEKKIEIVASRLQAVL
ncbi:MAG TPA: DUF262 domain-containing protein [Xanthobacteraceae bacterium]|jgi:hypothetical protein